MTRKRILHLIDTGGPGGAETVVANLATNWLESGDEHLVVVGRDDWLASSLRDANVEYLTVNAKGRFSMRYIRSLLTVVREFRPDVIISHLLGSNTYGCVVSKISKVPIICVFHGPTDFEGGRFLTAVKMWLIDWFAGSIVYVSDALANEVKNRFSMAHARSLTIHNGTKISKPVAGKFSKKKIGTTNFIVGCLGNLRPAKNYQMLLRVAHIMKNQGFNITFRVFGHQREDILDELLPLAKKLGVEEIVRWMGYTTDASAELESFDAFAITSSSEGIPLALLEAMAHSVPVVSTGVGGIPEVVENGETGFLVRVNDDELFAASLSRLHADSELRNRLTTAAAERVRKYFSIEHMAEKYSKLADSLIS